MTLLPRLQQHDNQYAPEVLDGVGTYRGLKNYLYYFVAPHYNYSIMSRV